MIQKLRNSWTLVKASAAVLRADKELLFLPILSAVAVVLVTIAFIVPSALGGLFDSESGIAEWVVVFLFFVTQYTVIIFLNSALVGAAMIRLEGGDPSVADGLRMAAKNIRNILGYAVIAATVGLLLRLLSAWGKGGEIAAAFIGVGWNLAVFLAVPVLVAEKVGPLEALKRSARLLKKTWGEQIAGNFTMGLVLGLLLLGVFILGCGVIVLALAINSLALLIATFAVLILAFLMTSLISAALSGIFTAALYRFAATGEAGDWFDEALVKNAFKPGE